MRLITGFVNKIVDMCVKHFVMCVAKLSTMTAPGECETLFKSFPYALEAIDVTFQEANRPTGNMQEGKVYFSGKHKLYRYKVQVAVRPNGLASAFSRHYPGSISDIKNYVSPHYAASKNNGEERRRRRIRRQILTE